MKENKMKMDSDTVGNIVEKALIANIHQASAETECEKIDKDTDMRTAEVNDSLVKNTSIGLILYGADTRILYEDFIRTYSSGKLDSYRSCSCFLNQKYLKK